jgi:hypothetical protein
MPIFTQTAKAVDSHHGCPCNCNEILYAYGNGGYENIWSWPDFSDCLELDFLITGCGGRTVTGFSFSFPHDDNPCLNQDWMITKIVDGNEELVGVYNPYTEDPSFGTFDPPVPSCETRRYQFSLCPEYPDDCKGREYEIGITFTFANNPPPCPTITKTIIIGGTGVDSDNSTKKFSVNSTKEYIRINQTNDLLDDAVLVIVNIFGTVVKQVKLNANETVIKTDNLITGKYYCVLKSNRSIFGFFNYTVVK